MNTNKAVALLLLVPAFVAACRADISRTIAFQGVLTAPTGAPKPDGQYGVTFRLYDASSGGNLLWTEVNKPVAVSGGKGLFSTSLGAPTPFGSVPFSAPYFVEVQIQGEAAPMTPRIALQAVPYAFSTGAANLSLPFVGSANLPQGSVLFEVDNTGTGNAIVGRTAGPSSALYGSTTATGSGVYGTAGTGAGVEGHSTGSDGVIGYSTAAGKAGVAGVSNGISAGNGIYGRSDSAGSGVWGTCDGGTGVTGVSVTGNGVYGDSGGSGIGVFGESASFEGVRGVSHNGSHGGVVGINTAGGDGVYGASDSWQGVDGVSVNSTGVAGYSTAWVGTYGYSVSNNGVWGRSTNGNGVYGLADNTGIGVYGESASFEGVRGVSHNVNHGGVVGINSTNGAGVYGLSQGGGYAGFFDGRCRVASLEIAGGADVAERFKITDTSEAGAVVAIDTTHPGSLCLARGAYNHTVAGILSGAGKLDAGMILSAPGSTGELAVAMSGRAWTLCDASYGAISPGDLLTTSDSAGYAMKVGDYSRVPGATVGKAMTGLDSGKGLVLVLVNLQ